MQHYLNLERPPLTSLQPFPGTTRHCGFKLIKSAKKFFKQVSVDLKSPFPVIKRTAYVFKECQTVVGISVISQFNEFLNIIFGGYLPFETTVRGEASLCDKLAFVLSSSTRLNFIQ